MGTVNLNLFRTAAFNPVMKQPEQVLTEIASGKVHCFFHNTVESWNRFSTKCVEAAFDKCFGLTSCYWYILRRYLGPERMKVLTAYYAITREEMDSILSGKALELQDRCKKEFPWFFNGRNLAKFSSHEDLEAKVPTIPVELFNLEPEQRVKLERLYDKVSKMSVHRVSKGEVSINLRLATVLEDGRIKYTPKKLIMSDFLEYLRIVSQVRGLTRVWDIIDDQHKVVVVAGSRSGPRVNIALSNVGSCVLV